MYKIPEQIKRHTKTKQYNGSVMWYAVTFRIVCSAEQFLVSCVFNVGSHEATASTAFGKATLITSSAIQDRKEHTRFGNSLFWNNYGRTPDEKLHVV